MSLPATTYTGTAPLAGVDEISIPQNAVLKFSYPNLDDPLYIHSGANSIKWNFLLNTQSTPTLGGEVVQVLSAAVGPITISGQTAGLRTNATGKLDPNQIRGWKNAGDKEAFTPNHELQAIIAWFRKYMTIAGTDAGGVDPRNRSIRFTYAERGWEFYVQPTALSGFRYDKATISPEWSITAEIVSNNGLDFFSGVTMSSFTDELLTTNTKLQGQIGLSSFAQTSTETNNPNFGQTGDHGSTNPFLNPDLSGAALAALKHMGDNFQGLVAAWSQGDFAHFGFGSMLDNNALPTDVNAVYEKLFGNTLLGSITNQPGSGGGGDGTGTYTYSGSNSQDAVAVQIANAFSAKSIPPELGIAVALHESNLDPTTYQGKTGPVSGDGAVGLFQTFNHSLAGGGAGAGAGLPHNQEIQNAQNHLTLGNVPPASYKTTDYYPIEHQVKDAAQWFDADHPSGMGRDSLSDDQLARWAFNAQKGVGYCTGDTIAGTCTPLFASDLKKARTIIQQLGQSSAAPGYTNPFPGGWIPNRLDQGYDGTFKGQIVAPVSGTITYAGYIGGPKPWGGWITLQADGRPSGLPTSTFYFAEGLSALVKEGDRVNKGDPIAAPAASPYGNPYATGGNGQIEWGLAADGPKGAYVGPYAGALGLGSSAARAMVLSFSAWVQKNLGVAPPSTTTDAGTA